jgi:hypothetical protein
MIKTRHALAITLFLVGAAACSKSKERPKANYAPCDVAAITALDADLDKANCVNVDLTKKEITDACAAKAKEITGKTYALEGCTFSSQGNDELHFGATGTDKTVGCKMKGGKKGLDDFRHEAMKLDMNKLRIDLVGVVASNGEKEPFERLTLTECQMTAHE